MELARLSLFPAPHTLHARLRPSARFEWGSAGGVLVRFPASASETSSRAPQSDSSAAAAALGSASLGSAAVPAESCSEADASTIVLVKKQTLQPSALDEYASPFGCFLVIMVSAVGGLENSRARETRGGGQNNIDFL